MNIQQIKCFVTLAETLHFGEAAKKLNITQPPLSRQIKLLETELEVELFRRTKRKVILTPIGQFLYKKSLVLLKDLNTIKQDIRQLKNGQTGTLNIGCISSTMHSILPQLLKSYHQYSPQQKIKLSEMTNEEQEFALQKGEIDIAFLRTPFYNEAISVEKIYDEHFSLVLNRNANLLKDGHFNLQDLQKEPFILLGGTCSKLVTNKILSIFTHYKFAPNVVFETSQANTALRLVESGLGYSIVPHYVANGYQLSLQFIELKGLNIQAELFIAYQKTRLHYGLDSFVNYIKETVKGITHEVE